MIFGHTNPQPSYIPLQFTTGQYILKREAPLGSCCAGGLANSKIPSVCVCDLGDLGCPGKEVSKINGDRINGLFHLLLNGVYFGLSPLPGFQSPPGVLCF